MRYFVVQSVGFSGSAFLSKVLNSHKDVMCFHEVELRNSVNIADDNKSYRIRLFFELDETERMLGHFYNISKVHKYFAMYNSVGTVETRHFNFELPEQYIPELTSKVYNVVSPSEKRPEIKFSYLIRSPVKTTNSLYSEFEKIILFLFGNKENPEVEIKLKVFESYLNNVIVYALRFLQDKKTVEMITGKPDPLVRTFGVCSMIVFSFFKYISTKDRRYIVTLEEITSDKTKFEEKAKEITGENYNISDDVLREKVNVHQGKDSDIEIMESWSREKRDIFSFVFSNCKDELISFGYKDVIDIL